MHQFFKTIQNISSTINIKVTFAFKFEAKKQIKF